MIRCICNKNNYMLIAFDYRYGQLIFNLFSGNCSKLIPTIYNSGKVVNVIKCNLRILWSNTLFAYNREISIYFM